MSAVSSLPPFPVGIGEINRVQHTRLRRRLLYSEFESDLVSRIALNVGALREEAWGKPDLTANPYLSMWTGAAALYDEEPGWRVPAGSEGLVEAMAEIGFFAGQQRVMRDALALREMLVRVDIDDVGALSTQPVFPDMVELSASPRRPSRPIRVKHFVEDPIFGWTTHDLDIRDPDAPRFVVLNSKGEDITKDVLGRDYSGKAYPFREDDSTPILPYVVYHAAETGCLFDPFTHREIVEGSLNIGVLLTFFRHLVYNASWPQRYLVNLLPAGLGVPLPGDKGRREIVADPSTVLVLVNAEGVAQGTAGQWAVSGDPEAILRAIGQYERRIQLLAGFAPPDVTRQEADIRSGYSLAVDREALRAKQRVFEPQFRRGDQEVMRVAACLNNRRMDVKYSEVAREYRPEYRGLPVTPAEERLRLEKIKAKRDAGMIGPISAMIEMEPGLNYDEALAKLARSAVEASEVEAETRALLDASGSDSTPASTPKPVGYITTAAALLAQAQAGEVPIESAIELLVSGCGFTSDQAGRMTASIVPRAPVPATPPTPPEAA